MSERPNRVQRVVEKIRCDESQLEEWERQFEETRRAKRVKCHITVGCLASVLFTVVSLIPGASGVVLVLHIVVACPIVGVGLSELADRVFRL